MLHKWSGDSSEKNEMHEITLSQNTVEIMQGFGVENNVQRITAVWIELGGFSCVEPEAFKFCFNIACRETLAEGCILHLDEVSAKSWCYACQKNIRLLSPGVLLCPNCGSHDLRVIADDGMTIKRIEIE